MQIDSTFSNAIHICVYLERTGKDLVNSTELGESIGTNPVVVRRIVGRLKEFGLVKVKQGIGGGYFLGKPSTNITLWDIYLAMKKENPFRCKIGNDEDEVSINLPEALEDTFTKAEYALKKPLSATTVKAVASRIE
ncbi:MAG: Rrf2 family transcriptional regulator [Flavobacteriales bacterium]